jgi:hypothetical protein
MICPGEAVRVEIWRYDFQGLTTGMVCR